MTNKTAKTEVKTVVDKVEDKKEVTETFADVKNGSFTVRTYSLEKHGEKFVELAKEFAGKAGGEVVVR